MFQEFPLLGWPLLPALSLIPFPATCFCNMISSMIPDQTLVNCPTDRTNELALIARSEFYGRTVTVQDATVFSDALRKSIIENRFSRWHTTFAIQLFGLQNLALQHAIAIRFVRSFWKNTCSSKDSSCHAVVAVGI